MIRFLSITLLTFSIFQTAHADIYSASAALSRGDYETAVKEFTKLAEQGDANAQANLGYMYYAGEGVPQSYEQAVIWYRKAATQGNKDAQYNLAVSYAFGEGVKQDLTEAAIWYRRAGEQGHTVSQYSLGISYAYGEGVPQDQKEAARWFKKAADQGYARAQVHLGSMYHTGEGVEQDYSEAVRWYRMAADRGDATAQYNLGTMYRSGKGVEQNYAQAKRWFRQSADQGYAAAQNELASLERSAASTVATRTIQTKPELPSVAETTSEPEPVKKSEPVPQPKEEKVAVKTEAPVDTSQQVTSGESEKKALFSVEKEDLLSLDDSQLDIAEPVVTEQEISNETVSEEIKTNVSAVEPAKEEVEVAKVDENTPETKSDHNTAIHKSLGIPAPTTNEETESSGGFFDKLFSKKERSESDIEVAKTEDVSETVEEQIAAVEETPKPEKKEVVLTPRVYPEDVKKAELAVAEKNEVVEELEPVLESNTEIDRSDEVANVSVTESDHNIAIHKSLGIPAPTTGEETESSGGFFDKLFSKKERSESDIKVAETEDVSETVEEQIAAVEETPKPEKKEVVLTPRIYPEDVKKAELASTSETNEEKPEVTDSNNWANAETNEPGTQDESSGGFFSAIGDFFSGKEKTEEDSFSNTSEEVGINSNDTLIAKVEEPAPVVEEIELAQEAETDLSQFSVDAGRRALTNSDYDEAYNQFKPLAESGNSEAQSYLGSLYYVGKGVSKDLEEAFNWYKKSAEQGNVDAQYSIGNMYLLGEGVEQNNATAKEWYVLASNQGHTAAKNNLYSLEKLEAINRENQLKQEALAAEEQKTEELEIQSEEVEVTALDADSTVAMVDETENTTSESPGFFESLFGKNETEETKTENLNLEATNEIESIAEETVEIEAEEEIIAAETVEETTDLEKETIVEPENIVTEANDELEDAEKSGGLFGFLGNMFSSDKEKETNIKEEVIPDEIAMIEESSVETSVELDESIVEDVETEIVEKSELELLQPIAIQGDQKAQYKLGTLYYAGDVVKQDYSQAALWYRRSAQQGNVDAQYSLGNMFLLGEGVNQDDEQAAEWYAMAAEQGHSSAKSNLENLTKTLTVEPEVVEEEFNDSDQLISLDDPVNEFPAEDDTGKTEYENGLAYAFGDGVAQNDRTAFNLFYEAAEKGYVLAQYKVGVAFAYGEGVRQDNKQAAEWYRRAAEQGHTIAQRNLATMYLEGKGVEQNKVQALAWYQVVASAGNAMDLHRRDKLKNELSDVELSQSLELSNQISNRIVNPSL